MDCEDVWDIGWDDPQVQLHLRDCPPCAALRLAWQSEVAELRAPQAPPQLTVRVLAALPQKSHRTVWGGTWSWVWRSLCGAALACYLVVFLALGYALSRPDAPPMLAPHLVLYWAGLPDTPGPLDGGL